MPAELPSGTVTLLFTDIEGSTRMLQDLGRETYVRALTEHRRLLREAFTSHGGVEVEMQGDSFHFAFPYARDAVAAAAAGQRALAEHAWESQPIKVRIGLHTGEPMQADGLYAGLDVHRAARVMSAAHGGQTLLSARTADLVSGELPAGVTLRDLGEHRLKDLTAPQTLFQLGEGEFPTLQTLATGTSLPIAGSPLLGRETELESVLALLRDRARLVTVTGTGGTGKTRLALQAAAELIEEFRDGVFWVPLAGLRDPSLVLASVAQALGSREDLAAHLADREMLIVLDNFEHVITAAADLAELLGAAPGLRALVTSRAPLHVDGEHEFPLDPLATAGAIALFVERARAAGRPLTADQTVAEICGRLDNLPLALELAAARTKLLGAEVLLGRLEKRLPLLTSGRRDAPERQRTLRATIEWSCELLHENAQQLFARLSVFAGSFSVHAAERLCDAELDTLDALVDLNLLKPTGDDRLLMLETIRELALEQSEAIGELQALRQRHGSFFLAVVEEAEPHLRTGGEQVLWLERLDADHANLREALSWWCELGDPCDALRFVEAAYSFWEIRFNLREAASWVERAMEIGGHCPAELQAGVLNAAGRLARWQGDLVTSSCRLEEALTFFRGSGDDGKTASCLGFLATVLLLLGEVERAESLSLESVERAGRSNDPMALGGALHNRGFILQSRGDWEAAAGQHEQALGLFRAAGRRDAVANALVNLGFIELVRGNPHGAGDYIGEALEVASEVGDSGRTTMALRGLGHRALATGDPNAADTYFGRALALARESGTELVVASLKDLAGAANASGQLIRGARLAGAALELERSLDVPSSEANRRLWSRSVPAREAHDSTEWRDAWESGRAMTLEAAVDYALERGHGVDSASTARLNDRGR